MVKSWVFCVVVLIDFATAPATRRRDYNFETNTLDPRARRVVCFLFGVCSTIITSTSGQRQGLEVVYQWKQLEFDYPTDQDRERAVEDETFIPGKPAPIDTDVYYGASKKKVFVSIPRFQAGVPVTLGTVTSRNRNGNPIIKPYPSWDWHNHPNDCRTDRIVSVYRMMVDSCDRLWVLDTGRHLDEQVCPPQLLAFDLKTDQLIHRYIIPAKQIESRSILVTPVVDIRASCDDTFVYIADCQTYSIIVYDVMQDTSWRVTDKTMYPYPNYGTFSIQGDSFDLMDGILGMALAPYVHGKDRKLYYHAMSSPTENYVFTSALRNQTLIEEHYGSVPEIFYTFEGQRRTQSAAEAMDKDGVLYFGLMSDVKLACFNTNGEYGMKKDMDIVDGNPTTLQFMSGIKIVTKGQSQELWAISSRFQKIGTDTLDPSEVNFRILTGKTQNLLQGSRCKSRSHNSGGGYGLIHFNE